MTTLNGYLYLKELRTSYKQLVLFYPIHVLFFARERLISHT